MLPLGAVQHFGVHLLVNPNRFWLACPLALILIEVAALTPFVEISSGPLTLVANHHVCAGLLSALAALVLLVGRDPRSLPASEERPAWSCFAWIAAHLILYLVFFKFSMRLSENPTSPAFAWLAGGAWTLLASGVGLSAIFIFFSLKAIAAWLWHCRGSVLTAGMLGTAVALAGSWAQSFWPQVCGPALALDRRILQWIYGEGFAGLTAQGLPVLGIPRIFVLVTPGCSALEAIPTMWLLAAAVFVPCWRDWRKTRLAIGMVVGTAAIYVLNAVRLVGLVVLGAAISPQVCVSVAHSQLGVIGFLAFDVVLLACLIRWCRKPSAASLDPEAEKPTELLECTSLP